MKAAYLVERELGEGGAAGDTAGALAAGRDYLFLGARLEPAQRKIDEEIRAKMAKIERTKR